MQILYRIIEAYPDEHQIVVRYYSDTLSEHALALQVDGEGVVMRGRTDVAITLPIPTPSGSDLDKIIMQSCPVGFFEMKAAVADPETDTSLSAILPLIGVESALNIAPVATPGAVDPVAKVIQVRT